VGSTGSAVAIIKRVRALWVVTLLTALALAFLYEMSRMSRPGPPSTFKNVKHDYPEPLRVGPMIAE
jgi:hypothetical protein